MTGRRRRRRKKLLDDLKDKNRILGSERGSIKSHSVEKLFWNRLWACCKIENRIDDKLVTLRKH